METKSFLRRVDDVREQGSIFHYKKLLNSIDSDLLD